jgi:hypothetical protein
MRRFRSRKKRVLPQDFEKQQMRAQFNYVSKIDLGRPLEEIQE